MASVARERSERRRGRGPAEHTVLWDVAKVLLVGTLVAFAVAVVLAARPVVNPGVQDCGAPLAFIVTNSADTVVPLSGPDAPEDAPSLRTQTPCSQRVMLELTRASMATAAGVVLGLVAVALGLLDDRMALRRAPRFEDLLRTRPAGAPTRTFDPVPTGSDDLARRRLTPIEPAEVAVLALSLPVAVALLSWAIADLGPRPSMAVSAWVVGGLVAVGARAAAAAGRAPLSDAGGFTDRLQVAVASGWRARLRPEVTPFGWQLRQQVANGATLGQAAAEARVLATAALAVHASVLLVACTAVLTGLWHLEVTMPEGRWQVVAALAAVAVVVNLSRLGRQLGALAVLPDRRSLRALVDPSQRTLAVHALGAAVVQFVLELAVLWAVVDGVGADVPLITLALLWGLTVALSNAGGLTPGGAGLAEVLLAVGLVVVGVPAPAAVVAAVSTRLVSFWAPMLVGAIASRWWPAVDRRASTRSAS